MIARERNESIFIVFLSIAFPFDSFIELSFQVLIRRRQPSSSGEEPEHTFPAIDEPLGRRISRKINAWITEYVPLFEAILVAISAHILAFPLFWLAGWVLPWPKSPEILTVIEIDLTHYADNGPVPKKVTDIFKSEMHAAK